MRYCFFANRQSIQLDLIQGSFTLKILHPLRRQLVASALPPPSNCFSAPQLLPGRARITNTEVSRQSQDSR